MKTIKTDVYTINELSDDAKEKARDWARTFVADYDWYDCIYEDAKTIGLDITSFDLDRNRHAKGKILTSAPEVAENIIANHGKSCDTYKLAKEYQKQLKIVGDSCDDDDKRAAWEEKREEIDTEFERDLLEDYSLMLQREYEHMFTDEYIDDLIEANEYTFTESGKRFG